MLKKTKIILFTAVSVPLIAAVFLLDKYFLGLLPLFRTSFSDQLFIFLGSSLGLLISLSLLSLLFLYGKKKRFIPYLIIAIILALALSYLLKYAIARPRPEILPLLLKTSPSFPSTHAFVASSTFFFLRKLDPPAQAPAFTLTFLVAFSGFYNGVHYLSDILAGIFLGIAVSCLALNRFPLMLKKLKSVIAKKSYE